MNHLTETLLNEYLDNTLDETARREVEIHVAACTECRAQLEDLASVFNLLATLPEEALARDLTPGILAHIPQKRSHPFWRLTLAAQTVAALGTMFWLAMTFAGSIKVPEISRLVEIALLRLPTFDLPPLILISETPVFNFPLPTLDPHLPTFHLLLPAFNLPTLQLAALLAAAMALWVVGNASLLCRRPEVRK